MAESFKELRDELERERRHSHGSRALTVIIILIFLAAGAFYLKTAKPELWQKAAAYVKSVTAGSKSLAALSEGLSETAPPEPENTSGESGEMLLTADSLGFSYLPHEPETAVPLMNATVTSQFGARTDPVTGEKEAGHHGIDLAASPGSKIYCYADGAVTAAEQTAVYGNCVTVDHGDGLESFYGHMSEILVSAGQRVRAGEPLGIIGSTGKSTGVHLHFEIRRDGERVDPAPYIYEKI